MLHHSDAESGRSLLGSGQHHGGRRLFGPKQVTRGFKGAVFSSEGQRFHLSVAMDDQLDGSSEEDKFQKKSYQLWYTRY